MRHEPASSAKFFFLLGGMLPGPSQGGRVPKPFSVLPGMGGSKVLIAWPFCILIRCFCLTPMCLEVHGGGGPPVALLSPLPLPSSVPNMSHKEIGETRVVQNAFPLSGMLFSFVLDLTPVGLAREMGKGLWLECLWGHLICHQRS